MTAEAPQPQPHRNALAAIGERLIHALPPGFVVVLVLNCVFIGVIAWGLDRNAEQRNELLTKIVDRCIAAHP